MSISTISNIRVGYAANEFATAGEDLDTTYYHIYYNGSEQEIKINEETTLTLIGWGDESRSSVNGTIDTVSETSTQTKEVLLNVSDVINELVLKENDVMNYKLLVSDIYKIDIVDFNTLNQHIIEEEITNNESDTSVEHQEGLNDRTNQTVENPKEEPTLETQNANTTVAETPTKNSEISDKSTLSQTENNLNEVIEPLSTPSVSFTTHVQDYGWQGWVENGAVSGTEGEAKRLEAIKISGIQGITYRTHVQDFGWQNFVSDGAISGTSGKAKRLEAIQIKLTGDNENLYDIYYRVHAQDYGWLGWAKNGQSAGTAGLAKRLEAIEIRLIAKNGQVPVSTFTPFVIAPSVSYSTHIQDFGWMQSVDNGALSGTSGNAKRLEAIKIQLKNSPYPGKVEYSTHVQDYGWLPNVTNNIISGTSGEGKRLEAITINLTGEMANHYDIYYRVHIQDFGWLGWAKNGMNAGSQNEGKRLEAIEIKLVPVGQGDPVDFTKAFIRSSSVSNPLAPNKTLISHAMGEIDGYYYTNSLEAFLNSYHNKGSRVFEVDFDLTLEGILVARHDWRLVYAEELMQTPETSIDNRPWTYDYFMKQSINKKYTPLDINGIIELLVKYPDITIVTDTKHLDPEIIEKQFLQIVETAMYDPEILSRVIPQIYNQKMLTTINNIYKFENVIYTLYLSPDGNEQVINFVKDNLTQITAVTMHTSRVNKDFLDKLHRLNVDVYTHPIWTVYEAIQLNKMGVDGIYSATVSTQELEMIGKE